MIGGERVIALIPARSGSKSVKDKNLQRLGNKPLIQWPIDCARETSAIDRIVVSTDGRRIAATARELGAEVYERPPELATDGALVIDTIRHLRDLVFAEGESARVLVLLEATSPFRSPALVERCLQRLLDEGLDSIATFHPADINPERTWKIVNGEPRPFIDGAIPWRPRQALSPAYQLNGAVYAFRWDKLPEDGPSILFGRMGAELIAADEVIDIDTAKDFKIANAILEP